MTRLPILSTLCLAALVSLGASGCAAELGDGATDEVLIGGEVALHGEHEGTQVIYVNFDGVRVNDCDGYCSEAPRNRSWAIGAHFGASRVDFAAYGGGSSARRQIVDIIRAAFADYDVVVTTSRPSSGHYTMVIISPTSGPNHGVAPLDCGNRNHDDIAFVYKIGRSSPGWIGQAAVHELGHSFGLGHVTSESDFMQWASSGRNFTRSSYDWGHESGRCFEGSVQDAPAMLRESLGAHRDAPPSWDGTFADDDGSVHEADIERLAAAGVTRGCGGGDVPRYCPRDAVTRGQMAVFLQRAMSLPRSSVDHFDDDDGAFFEAAANAVADAGITYGCGGRRFCGDRSVTRAQMASFLARALSLPAPRYDNFVDDDGNTHERDIDRIAEAGVTRGCGGDRYCPDSSVTRAQMASFLVRAFEL